eukprot:2402828-Alexandrium_andersonii.AAC.1
MTRVRGTWACPFGRGVGWLRSAFVFIGLSGLVPYGAASMPASRALRRVLNARSADIGWTTPFTGSGS